MLKKLTAKEKELIGIILDFEKESLRLQERVQFALTGESVCYVDLVDACRIYEALNIAHIGDDRVHLIMGYAEGRFTLEEVFEFIELVMNDDIDGATKWWERHE